MTDQDAYRRYTAAAEICLSQIEQLDTGQADVALAYAGAARAWATLALAAAQDRVIPADRPATGYLPNRVKDGDGDLWTLDKDAGWYTSASSPDPHTLEHIARDYNGYTEVDHG